jgi:hypothetical protein
MNPLRFLLLESDADPVKPCYIRIFLSLCLRDKESVSIREGAVNNLFSARLWTLDFWSPSVKS